MKSKATRLLTVWGVFIFLGMTLYGQDSLIINEFMAINKTGIQDEDSTYPDWIEIYNGGSAPVSLAGWCLTDDPTNFFKWPFPDISLAAKEYLIVFASGKDRKTEKDKLHTNFKLSGSGEFLALSKPLETKYNSVFAPTFPKQYDDISYAFINGEYTYAANPTPGADNDTNMYLVPPQFSMPHGFYDNTFQLELLTGQPGAEIYYTLNASAPNSANGTLYTGPIEITGTSVIRAVAVHDIQGSSESRTRSYIFLDDVPEQSENQPGYPTTWLLPKSFGEYDEIPTHYGLDQTIVDMEVVNGVLKESLKSLPVMSIVTDIDHLFSKSTHPDSGGIYIYSGEPNGSTSSLNYHLGRGWERPASVEYFNSDKADGEIDFQENCLIKIHGGASRSTRKTLKRSFKLGFKGEYGPTKLKAKVFGKGSPNQYDWLILRGGFDRRLGLQIIDPWAKAALKDMGQYAANNKFVHLYINGLYWGMYNLSERMDENCMRDNLGGKANDYDIVKDYYEIENGDSLAWDQLLKMSKDNIQDNTNYQKLLGNNPDGTRNPSFDVMLNAESLIDYILLNIYEAMGDWDHHNWIAARRKTNSEGFHFLVWDAEFGLNEGSILDFLLGGGNSDRPSRVFYNLLQNQQFRDHFASRVNHHFFEGGALIPENCLKRYEDILASIDTALIADQARWVADRRDIWNKSYHEFIYDYFPGRTETVFKSMVNAGIYPNVEAPGFNEQNSTIPESFELMLTGPDPSEIRYSLDGTDPGHYSLMASSSIKVYDGSAIPLPGTGQKITISARAKKDTLWSVLVRKTFTVGQDVSIFTDHFPQDPYFYNYPNPVTEHTQIVFSIAQSAHVSIKVYNALGETVAIPFDGWAQAGAHTVNWNAGGMPAGIYVCVLQVEGKQKPQRIKMVKE
jgi:hypothetical protein